ncbi:hypothetical protein ABIC83_002834 [Roseateles asaccharophilus]|uniref:hypothetical protein n=1 Tax=Roseateles asaccharophilus TaxID=582607 RepID=UPI0038354CAC
MKAALLLVACAATLPAAAQQMYRCGSTYSQTPCGSDAKEVKVQVAPACQDETTRYTSACIDQRIKEISAPTRAPVTPTKPSKDMAEAQKEIDAARLLPAPPAEVVNANLRTCEASIRASMKDPEAARITDGRRAGAMVYLVKQTTRIQAGILYTFMVNGKNSYGAYTGSKPFECYFDMSEKALLQVSP